MSNINVLSHLMKIEDYEKISHPIPYIFQEQSSNKHLLYFGSPHSADPNNPVFVQIRDEFNKFKPDFIVIEGISSATPEKVNYSEQMVLDQEFNEIIKSRGESGFTLKLAVENKIKWGCPEPQLSEIIQHLLKGNYKKEEIFAWYISRVIPQFQMILIKSDFAEYVEKRISVFEQETNWPDFNYSYERFMELLIEIIGPVGDIKTDKTIVSRLTPKNEGGTIFNRIAKDMWRYRDELMINYIHELSTKFNRIFVVYGSSHAVVQEPALKELFKQLSL